MLKDNPVSIKFTSPDCRLEDDDKIKIFSENTLLNTNKTSVILEPDDADAAFTLIENTANVLKLMHRNAINYQDSGLANAIYEICRSRNYAK